jgi:hypothetical protein
MDTLLKGPVQSMQPHALPFRVIFEEHLTRNKAGLLRNAKTILAEGTAEVKAPAGKEKPENMLLSCIAKQENAYEALAVANKDISEGRSPRVSLDILIANCKKSDERLKLLLHSLESSALCLSGGGIRSASFSLGVLEGLSLFSDPVKGNGLMHSLDYLSTVSGGGYIGSWLISWVHQSRKATGLLQLLEDTVASIQKWNEALDSLKEGQATAKFADWRNAITEIVNSQQVLAELEKPKEGKQSNLKKRKKTKADPKKAEGKIPADLKAAREKIQAELELERAKPILAKLEEANRSPEQNLAPITEDRDRLEQIESIERAIEALGGAEVAISETGQPDAHVDIEGVADKFRFAEDALLKTISIISRQAYTKVISAMAGKEPVTSGDAEQLPVRHLRSYTSYLAPSVGFTLDTFTLAAIVSRNILINWVMLIPLALALVSVAKITGFETASLEGKLSGGTPYLITLAYFMAAVVAGVALPSHYKLLNPKLWRWSAPAFISSVILASWLLTDWQLPITNGIIRDGGLFIKAEICVFDFGALTFFIWLAYKAELQKVKRGILGRKIWAGVIGVLATVTISALTAWLLQLTRLLYPILLAGGGITFLQSYASDRRLFIVFGLPFTITILMATTSLFCALLGLFEVEEDREWWARCGGALLIFNLAWIVAHGIAFYGLGFGKRLLAGVSGLLLGLVGSLVGYSGATSAGPRPVKAAQLSGFAKFLEKHKLILPFVGGVSLLLIVLGIAAVEENLREAISKSGLESVFGLLEPPSLLPTTGHGTEDLESAVVLFGASLIFAVIINFAININLFSLHGMYRMRLMRAFLGASNVRRRPDPFTNFDPADTPLEMDLPACHGVPLHIINATLNLTGTKNTAWKQRRAESFTFNPIQCGGWRVGYVKAGSYGGTRGLTLATAMSISGAAFNPNMGYQSSSILSLLMTFFNLRLGCWLPNPKRPTPKLGIRTAKLDIPARDEVFFRKNSPTCALQPLIAEVLGNTDDEYRWIELTDGGHFENLGLYEMVMRRCKNIIVIDAGADPTCQFEDLGNAIRKIRIDLGIPIDFPPDLRMKAGMKVSNSYCVVARIHYHCVDPIPEGSDGWLVYIKAGLTGREPADILQYAKTHPRFPHETTGNQFFNESQFESYRHLGSHVVRQIAKMQRLQPGHANEILWKYKDHADDTNTIKAFTKAAENFWNRPHDDAL